MDNERGLWLEEFDDPERIVTPEEMEAWKPLVEGEKAARRAAAMLSILTTGMDSEISALHTPEARKLRQSYGKLWTDWRVLDLKCDDRWHLGDVVIEISGAAAYRRAREFDPEKWIVEEVPKIRSSAVVGVRVVLAVLDTRAPKPERRIVNQIISIINKEIRYLRWSL